MPSEPTRWRVALALLALPVAACSPDVTAKPEPKGAVPEATPGQIEVKLSPQRDSARYEFLIEQRGLDAAGRFETAEGEIEIQFTEFDTGRVRATFRVRSVEAKSGERRDSLSPSQAVRNRLEGLSWSSKHDPTGTIIGPVELARSDNWGFLGTIGAERGFFGIAYPSGPVAEGKSWRASTPGVEWQLAGVSEWLATLEGVVELQSEDAAVSQSVRARIEIASGLPLEMVGDETVTKPDSTAILRHWSLSRID